MTSAATPAPFYAFAFALSAACVFALAQLPDAMRRLEAVSIAAGILSIWYAARPSENYNRPFGETILSIKYPLIAYAVAPTLPVDGLSFRAIALLGGLYAIVCAYAYADDPELRHSFTSWRSIP